MGFDATFHALSMTLQVFFIDLILSGDNALVIALACRALPPAQMRRAMLIGTGAAIGLRVVFTGAVALLLDVPGIKLVGALALIVIAIKLVLGDDADDSGERSAAEAASDLWSAVAMIVIADLVMSLDNVVALAAATQGSLGFLVLGLLFSVPLLMFGALIVTRLMDRVPLLIPAAGAFLGWIAGDIAVADPLVAAGVAAQSPALAVVVPVLCAVFVVGESRIIARERAAAPAAGRRQGSAAGDWLRRAARAITAPAPATAAATATVPVPAPPRRLAATPVVAPEVVTAAVTTPPAEAAHGPAAPAAPLRWTARAPFSVILSPAGALTALLAVVGVFAATHFTGGLPAPRQLTRFECVGARAASFYYRHGADRARMTSDAGAVDAYMQGTRIVWPDYDAATRTLGFAPPVEIAWEDTRSVRLDGGDFAQVECVGR